MWYDYEKKSIFYEHRWENKLVQYKFSVWRTNGEFTMSLSHLWWAHLKVLSWLVFVLNEQMSFQLTIQTIFKQVKLHIAKNFSWLLLSFCSNKSNIFLNLCSKMQYFPHMHVLKKNSSPRYTPKNPILISLNSFLASPFSLFF